MKRALIAVSATLLLAGCATPEWYQKQLNSHIGRPASSLVGSMPLVDGKAYMIDESYFLYHTGTDYKPAHCEVMMISRKGIITDIYAKGNMPWCSDEYAAKRIAKQ
jgi:hypothetical protein